jgi:hypothetical protein
MHWREIKDTGVVVELLHNNWLRTATLGVVNINLAVQSVLNKFKSLLETVLGLVGERVGDILQDFGRKWFIPYEILSELLTCCIGSTFVEIYDSEDHELLDAFVEKLHGFAQFKLLDEFPLKIGSLYF